MCIKHRWTFQSQLQVNVHWVASQILYLIHFNVNSRELFTRTSLWITEHNNCLKPQKAAHFSFKFLGSILPAVRHCHGVFPRSKSLTRGKQTPKLEREREREREREASHGSCVLGEGEGQRGSQCQYSDVEYWQPKITKPQQASTLEEQGLVLCKSKGWQIKHLPAKKWELLSQLIRTLRQTSHLSLQVSIK